VERLEEDEDMRALMENAKEYNVSFQKQIELFNTK